MYAVHMLCAFHACRVTSYDWTAYSHEWNSRHWTFRCHQILRTTGAHNTMEVVTWRLDTHAFIFTECNFAHIVHLSLFSRTGVLSHEKRLVWYVAGIASRARATHGTRQLEARIDCAGARGWRGQYACRGTSGRKWRGEGSTHTGAWVGIDMWETWCCVEGAQFRIAQFIALLKVAGFRFMLLLL